MTASFPPTHLRFPVPHVLWPGRVLTAAYIPRPIQGHLGRKTGALRLAALFLLLGLGPGACSDTDPGTMSEIEVTVADSAGVQVTTSRGPDLRYAVLDTIPRLPLGSPAEGSPTSFAGVQGVVRDSAGRLWVADGQANELRVFEADGTHLATRGGRGEGPGEFQQLLLLGVLAGDTIVAGDRVLPRITAYGPDAALAWTRPLPVGDSPPSRPFAVFPDGSLLSMARASLSVEALSDGEVIRENNPLLRIAVDGDPSELGKAPGAAWVWTGSALVPLPFTTPATFALVDEALHVVEGAGARVNVYRDGRRTSSYGIEEESRVVGPEDVDAYRTFVRTWIPEEMQRGYEDLLDHEERPAVLPIWDRMLAGAGGGVWIRRYVVDPLAPRDWDVFDFEGRWQGQVHVEAGFEPLQILDSTLLGVWRSELGVEEIRQYGFRTPDL